MPSTAEIAFELTSYALRVSIIFTISSTTFTLDASKAPCIYDPAPLSPGCYKTGGPLAPVCLYKFCPKGSRLGALTNLAT